MCLWSVWSGVGCCFTLWHHCFGAWVAIIMCLAEEPHGPDLFMFEVAKSLKVLLVVTLNLYRLQTAKQCPKLVPKKEMVFLEDNTFVYLCMKNIYTVNVLHTQIHTLSVSYQ